ncbi:hypothetical protein F2Q70_00008746 [Brassica cretica]|uniref:Uncharacterized protein n=2 Tax=Brassica TaxID=3705 RepID=A0A8S9JNM4_BRACR|nr:hypothetical protein F2Q68_00001810 [Brassica cretica]KAF2612684.1 hypothetical protein F2Q70_00008746 [Brassica cretica]KAF3512050.1 hypothetical protein F2Q69_00002132 [Brassica cretica]
MQEANQEVPEWLTRYASRSSFGGGRNRRGGGWFGGHDFLDKGHTVEEEAVVVAITMAVKEKEEEAMVMDMVPQVVDIAEKLQVLGD